MIICKYTVIKLRSAVETGLFVCFAIRSTPVIKFHLMTTSPVMFRVFSCSDHRFGSIH